MPPDSLSFVCSRILAYWNLLPTSLRIFFPQLNLFGNILIDTPYRYVSTLNLNLDKTAVKVKYPSPFPSNNLEYLAKVQMPWSDTGPLNLCWAYQGISILSRPI